MNEDNYGERIEQLEKSNKQMIDLLSNMVDRFSHNFSAHLEMIILMQKCLVHQSQLFNIFAPHIPMPGSDEDRKKLAVMLVESEQHYKHVAEQLDKVRLALPLLPPLPPSAPPKG